MLRPTPRSPTRAFRVRIGPGLAFLLAGLPETLERTILRFLDHYPVKEGVGDPARGLLRIEGVGGSSPDGPFEPVASRGPLTVSRGSEGSLRFETSGVTAWYDGDDRAVIDGAGATGEECAEFVAYGLVPLLFELAATRGWIGLHAAAVAVEGTGVLLPGPSGSGKSTLFRTALEAGFDGLSDDLVWLRPMPERDGGGERCEIVAFPRGWPSEPAPESTREAAPLGAVVFPTIRDREESWISPAEPGFALAALLSQASRLSEGPRMDRRLETLGSVAATAPAFRLEAGRDRNGVQLVAEVVAGLS